MWSPDGRWKWSCLVCTGCVKLWGLPCNLLDRYFTLVTHFTTQKKVHQKKSLWIKRKLTHNLWVIRLVAVCPQGPTRRPIYLLGPARTAKSPELSSILLLFLGQSAMPRLLRFAPAGIDSRSLIGLAGSLSAVKVNISSDPEETSSLVIRGNKCRTGYVAWLCQHSFGLGCKLINMNTI